MAKPTILFLIALLVLGGGGFGARELMLLRAEKTIERHKADIAHQMACESFNPTPPVSHPWGEDNAWDLLHPALDSLWEVRTTYASRDELRFELDWPQFNGGDPVHAAREFESEKAGFEACRRAATRTSREWKGPLDPELPSKGCLAGQHLSTRAYLAWREGRDAEAVDDLIAALTIAQVTARFDQPHSEGSLRTVERWASMAGCLLLSKHGLSASQLEDFERRLDLLRASRPRLHRQLRWWGASMRDQVLERWDNLGLGSLEDAGWRDLFSERVRMARILNGLGDAAKEAESASWVSSAELEVQWEEIGSRFRKEDVGLAWTALPWYQRELLALYHWDSLRFAVGVARFEAANGRMPKTLEEAGLVGILRRPVAVLGDGLDIPPLPPDPLNPALRSSRLNWVIRRR